MNIVNAESVQIIAPDPEILRILRLFLEKYEVLAEGDREMYRGVISCLVNPPLKWKMEAEVGS